MSLVVRYSGFSVKSLRKSFSAAFCALVCFIEVINFYSVVLKMALLAVFGWRTYFTIDSLSISGDVGSYAILTFAFFRSP
jgi:hypothetical protein